MCGRFVRSSSPEIFAELFGAQGELSLAPSHNVAPSQSVLAARNTERGRRELAQLYWGLIPRWAKEPKTPYSTINARAETVATKPTFRDAFRRRRCLVAADGFFEWKRLGTTKQPYFIHLEGRQPFAFAGVWDHWAKGGQVIESCAIIVTAANAVMHAIHDRMPVILDPENYSAWLNPEQKDPQPLLRLLQPYTGHDLQAYPVSTRVNSPKNNTSDLLIPAR